MTGTTKRLARLAIAVIFVVPVIVGSLATTSTAAPSKEDVERAEAKAEEIGSPPRGRDRAVQRGPRPAQRHPGEARRHAGREGAGRRRGRGCHRGPGGSRGRGVHRLRHPARRVAGCSGPDRVLRPPRVHGRGRAERRRPRRAAASARQRAEWAAQEYAKAVGQQQDKLDAMDAQRASISRHARRARGARGPTRPGVPRLPRSPAGSGRRSGGRRPKHRHHAAQRWHPGSGRLDTADGTATRGRRRLGGDRSGAVGARRSLCVRFRGPQRWIRLLGSHDVRVGARRRVVAALVPLAGQLRCRRSPSISDRPQAICCSSTRRSATSPCTSGAA